MVPEKKDRNMVPEKKDRNASLEQYKEHSTKGEQLNTQFAQGYLAHKKTSL